MSVEGSQTASGLAPEAVAADGLRGAPLLFVFYETSELARQRLLFERELGLRVIENQFHPPHHSHGLVKYDAGGTILALNLAPASRFAPGASDGFVAVFSASRGGVGPGRFADADGHHYELRPPDGSAAAGPVLRELRLTVGDLARSEAFYSGVLGLPLLRRTDRLVRVATGSADLVLERGERAADGSAPCHNTYLLVFHAASVRAAYEGLARRGLPFNPPRFGFSEIGGTARFADPDGHPFCLYEPSAESLTWGSGPKVREIIAPRGVSAPAASSLFQGGTT
jgi:catechol 2,3-dioxygenase-like lactoylglutathione lyase family enzyme